MREVDSVALQQTLRSLDVAYKNFLEHRAKHPKQKSDSEYHQSYRTQNNNDTIKVIGNHIQLPKIGKVKLRPAITVNHIYNAIIKKEPSGKYFVMLYVDFEPDMIAVSGAVGIDVGIKTFFTSSDGEKVDNPKYLEHATKRLKREARRLRRKQVGSSNWEKNRKRLAVMNEKIVNQRNDFLHKHSTRLIKTY